MHSFNCLLVVGLSALAVAMAAEIPKQAEAIRCKNQVKTPKRIEDTISKCQDEIKLAILQEVLGELNDKQQAATPTPTHVAQRVKRDAFDNDERRIAGCLLHCVYRKVKAIDGNGYPTLEGLVRLYTEGVDEPEYYNATARGAQTCLARSVDQTSVNQSGRTLCDVAYDMFECLTSHLDEYCRGANV